MNRLYFFIFLLIIFLSVNESVIPQISVERIDQAGLEKIIKERNDKVLLINLWATWCVPCREEFPALVKINDEFKNRNVDVVGISIDYPDEITSKIIPFLKDNNSNFRNYVNGFPKDEDLINAIDESWNGALPATIIYDRYGNKVAFLEGKRTYEEFKTELEKAGK